MKFKDTVKDIIIPISAIVISLVALYFAWQANSISENNRDDIRDLNKLNIDPKISFMVHLEASNDRSPYIEITNSGSLNIIWLEIKLFELRYDTKKEKILLAHSGSDIHWKFNSLNVNQSKHIEIPKPWFEHSYYNELTRLDKKPIETIVIEALISFKRESDLKLYKRRAFYFLDSDGGIKKENMISDIPKFHNILKAAHDQRMDHTLIEHTSIMRSDILHDLK